MYQKAITINNVPVDLVILDNFLNKNQKIEAIKYIVDHCNVGLRDAKNFVDNYDPENIEQDSNLNFPKKEGVQIKTLKNTIEVRYCDDQGIETLVNPDHILWKNVKRIMHDSLKIKEYEDAYYKENSITNQNVNPITVKMIILESLLSS
ncbi:hypothetical protein EG240_02370 [Paenimyroides tangerinum]|uniref:Uncharacterized protein n=1 Tax=Paenimyroides tangerinum TaxID=2488728 RepID=A0A3P3WIU3_9FLAO|nr:hypothetical protein [Paenimyroides tangerinum]RRJ92653.1 hypothetical protein EG240_02370 [Paenimyroides tangerinum]